MLSRRDFLLAVASIPVATFSFARAEDTHGHHSKNPYADIIGQLGECISTGELCNAHCQMLLAQGDSTLGACQKAVLEMLTASESMIRFASLQSTETKTMKAITERILTSCKKECLKHKKHPACQACAESCEKALAQMAKL